MAALSKIAWVFTSGNPTLCQLGPKHTSNCIILHISWNTYSSVSNRKFLASMMASLSWFELKSLRKKQINMNKCCKSYTRNRRLRRLFKCWSQSLRNRKVSANDCNIPYTQRLFLIGRGTITLKTYQTGLGYKDYPKTSTGIPCLRETQSSPPSSEKLLNLAMDYLSSLHQNLFL
jgi:hypothetical protein